MNILGLGTAAGIIFEHKGRQIDVSIVALFRSILT